MRCELCSLLAVWLLAIWLAKSDAATPDFSIRLAQGPITPAEIRTIPAISSGHIVIQFRGPVTESDRENLANSGINLLEYLPYFAYTARINRQLSKDDLSRFGIRWLGRLKPEQKFATTLVGAAVPEWAKRKADSVQITVALYGDEDVASWSGRLAVNPGGRVLGYQSVTNAIELILPSAKIQSLADLDAVSFIEPALPPQQEHNNGCRVSANADSAQSAPLNLTGSGVMVGIWDGGRADNSNPDLTGRIISTDASGLTAHATHVAGTILGNGTQSSGTYRGMAPLAQTLTHLWWSTSSEMLSQYQDAILNYSAEVSNNSWGVGVTAPVTNSDCDATLGNYFIEDATIDQVVRGAAGAPITIVWSAGNMRSTGSQYCGSIGWTWNTIDPLASSKNVIAVGAVNSNDNSMTSFSSWGPTDDGRIKPDLVAPGCQTSGDFGVTSTNLGSGYLVMCGTSMAAPVVTGVVALMRQRWGQTLPSPDLLPSTIKGILINTATDLGAVGPDFQYGWGLINAAKAVRKIGIGWPSWVESEMTTGGSHTYSLTVPPSTSKLKVTLIWDDKGGTSQAGGALINDLDLVLIDPSSNQVLPWVLNPLNPSIPATHGTDHTNNVETVEIASPASGNWTAVVTGYNIPNGPQKYSLIFTPDSVNGTRAARAVDIRKEQDTSTNPGQSASIGFWAKNIGTLADTVRVTLTDSLGWLTTTMDTIVRINSFDSVQVARTATVPTSAPAGTATRVFARIRLVGDSTIFDTATTLVSARAVYSISMRSGGPDTVLSPSVHSITGWVKNSGNAVNNVVVTASNDSGWAIQPSSVNLSLNPGDSGAATFSLTVPTGVPHHATNLTTLSASGLGGSIASAAVNVVIYNPILPPQLLSPDTVAYTKVRDPKFVWSADGTHYRLVIATDSGLNTTVRAYEVATDSTFTIPLADSLADNNYWWGVKAYSGTDSSSYQLRAHKLVIDNLPPADVHPVWPVAGSYPNQTHFSFSFEASPPVNPTLAPEFSTIEVAADSGFASGLKTYTNLTTQTLVMPDVLLDGRWYWRIRAQDKAGNATSFSAGVPFILDTEAPSAPTASFPPTGVTVGAYPKVHFAWTPVAPPAHPASPQYYRFRVAPDSLFSTVIVDTAVFADSLEVSHAGWPQEATLYWDVQTRDSAGWGSGFTTPQKVLHVSHVCADWDNSSGVDIADVSLLISYLYLNGPPLTPSGTGSVDCQPGVDISDLSWLIGFLFLNGPPPCCY